MKTKLFIKLSQLKTLNLLLFFSLFSSLTLLGQGEPDTVIVNTVESTEVIFESPLSMQLLSNAVIRFKENASVYLQWAHVSEKGYNVSYRSISSLNWKEFSTSSNEIVINDLPLEKEFVWKVTTKENKPFSSSLGSFATTPQTEPIQVSSSFYRELSGWFTQESNQKTFCDFLNDIKIHPFEKLSFLQAYAFDNKPFVQAGNFNNLSAWYPIETNIGAKECIPLIKDDCKCKVISQGSNLATPNGGLDEANGIAIVKPRVSQFIARAPGDKTYVDRFESGAAKFVSLRQDEGAGGMSYEMSNQQGGDDPTAETTQTSEVQFFLACMRDGGFSTNLPEKCQCKRPLYINYEYATRLHVKAEKKSCIWSKGAAAQAEDMAFVVAYNQRTGDLNALDAGQSMIGRGCNSAWNPDFWLGILDLAETAVQFYIQTQSNTGNNLPTTNQITNFIQDLQSLVGTPFSNNTGTCGSLQQDNQLVSGSSNLTLIPNEPIRVGLFSSYYVRTRGYGCYRAEAGIASDYFLMGVVESELTDDKEDECCSDKFATYILGSLSTPEEGDVHVEAVNSIENRMQEVGFHLSSYGTWEGLETGSSSGQTIIKKEFDLLRGPSCSETLSGGGKSIRNNLPKTTPLTTNDQDAVQLYPTIVEQNMVYIETKNPTQGSVHIDCLNLQGQSIKNLNIQTFENGFQFSTAHWSSGVYIAHIVLDNQDYNFKFFVP